MGEETGSSSMIRAHLQTSTLLSSPRPHSKGQEAQVYPWKTLLGTSLESLAPGSMPLQPSPIRESLRAANTFLLGRALKLEGTGYFVDE